MIFTSLALALAIATEGIAGTSAAERTRVSPGVLRSPVEYQVFQRTTRTAGKMRIAGAWSSKSSDSAVVEMRLLPADSKWRLIGSRKPGESEFSVDLEAPAGGWYRLEARWKNGSEVFADRVVEHVGVGEVFVIAGQSNSANHGEEKQNSLTRRVAAFHNGKWQIANDPQPGASGNDGSFIPPFADAIVERFNVPVGIVATGIGGTSVREWLPRGTRFPNPPTVFGNVKELPDGEWESAGRIFDRFTSSLLQLGLNGFRAVLWHQGESDANQKDESRTLPGKLYKEFLAQLIRDSRQEAGWIFPWFVAQASYHGPNDRGSEDIRGAQSALWASGIALEGPDTDALMGDLREQSGNGVHFSAEGLRQHGARWAEKVSPWLEQQLALTDQKTHFEKSKVAGPAARLGLPGVDFTVAGHSAFMLVPDESHRNPQPWVFYAPTLPGLPDAAEKWMHQQFLAAGIAVAGVDAGEGYGSPASRDLFDALYRDLTEKHGFAKRYCLLGRSRGGLWISSWAIAGPDRVSGLAGIYPVFDFRSYPGITNAAPAYDLTPSELDSRVREFNPINQIDVLARAGIPAFLIHGDSDKVVPMQDNSAEFVRRYREAGAESLVKLIVLEGQGHNYFEGFFHSGELVKFVIEHARAGAQP